MHSYIHFSLSAKLANTNTFWVKQIFFLLTKLTEAFWWARSNYARVPRAK